MCGHVKYAPKRAKVQENAYRKKCGFFWLGEEDHRPVAGESATGKEMRAFELFDIHYHMHWVYCVPSERRTTLSELWRILGAAREELSFLARCLLVRKMPTQRVHTRTTAMGF